MDIWIKQLPPAILRVFEIKKKRYPEFATQDNIEEILFICWLTVSIIYVYALMLYSNKKLKSYIFDSLL